MVDGALKLPRQSCDIRLWSTIMSGLLPGTKVIIWMGQSYRALRQDATLNQLRGSPWVDDQGIVHIATYLPQDTLDRKEWFDGEDEGGSADEKSTDGTTKRANWAFWLKADLAKAVEILHGGLKVVAEQDLEILSIDSTVNLLTSVKSSHLYLDIETDSQYRLTCIGYKFPGQPPRVIPMYQTQRSGGGYFYGELDTARLLRSIAIAMRDNTTVIHNSMFDLLILAWRYGIPPGRRIIDTMLLTHRCFVEVEKSLGHCLSLYTHQPYHKNEGVFEPRSDSQAMQLYRYNAKDVCALEILLPRMLAKAESLGAMGSVDTVMTMIHPYLTAMLQGLRVDVDSVRQRITDNLAKMVQVKRILNILCGYDINPRSPPQVAKYLYDKTHGMGYKRPAKDPTDEKNLLNLTLQHDNPALRSFLEYRHLGKENGQMKFTLWGGPTVMHDPSVTPRTTTSYKLAGTITFRLASSKLLKQKTGYKGWGGNLQNLPKELRKIVVPDEGKVFVQVDQSGAEALIVSYLTDNRHYRQLFLNNIKPHTFVAMHLFRRQWEDEMGCSLMDYINADIPTLKQLPRWAELNHLIKSSDNWIPSKRYYFIAKMVVHASSYGMKGPTFRANVMQKSDGRIVLSLADANHFLNYFHNLFPEIRAWQQDVVMQIHRDRTLENLFGHPRKFTTPHLDDSVYKEAYAFVPQSTVGMITNLAFVELQQQIENGELPHGTDILQNNHDSVLMQCVRDNSTIADVIIAAQRALNRPLRSPRGEIFFMKSEASMGDSWGCMREIVPEKLISC